MEAGRWTEGIHFSHACLLCHSNIPDEEHIVALIDKHILCQLFVRRLHLVPWIYRHALSMLSVAREAIESDPTMDYVSYWIALLV